MNTTERIKNGVTFLLTNKQKITRHVNIPEITCEKVNITLSENFESIFGIDKAEIATAKLLNGTV